MHLLVYSISTQSKKIGVVVYFAEKMKRRGMKRRKIKRRYCCVPNMALDICRNKEKFLDFIGSLWDIEHKKKCARKPRKEPHDPRR